MFIAPYYIKNVVIDYYAVVRAARRRSIHRHVPAGTRFTIVQSVAGANGGATFLINLSDRVNKFHLEDNAFMFTLMES
jgi:hypothetical protein